jgi:hypothetical protein
MLHLLNLHFVALDIRTHIAAVLLSINLQEIEHFPKIKTLLNLNNCYSK